MLDRLRAFAVHLLLSFLVALATLLLVFQIWYPAPLSVAMGVTHIFLVMLLVDVTLGPVLTFCVFKKGKKTLKVDLAVIAALQVGALIYGLHTVAEGRPVWLVFTTDRFDAVRPIDIDFRFPDKVAPDYASPPVLGPRWVAAVRPDDLQADSDIVFESVFGGADLQHRPYLYRPLNAAVEDISARAQPLDRLEDFNSSSQVADVLKRWPEADAWLPLMASVKPMVVLIKKQSAEIVAIVDLAPWAY
ncbi:MULTISPECIES: TfpX/TfpZ family type IV pilin accessory protein [unclassified Microbulbifer]|uniref:TfpX/TfpZ family type IV pilin accessory protein n=1 Tax=unclassified Microbulbifer TaxID=2619833 RepID=UPI0027E5A419|nr:MULTISPECIES: TfpX/TfpZ family type IV pilin accessory protein [unclassified Microbulbifer]